jgi:cell fate (sporulation/competence/biofilm development) regulator YlbF (YheA/YmcA/DUF963 family)
VVQRQALAAAKKEVSKMEANREVVTRDRVIKVAKEFGEALANCEECRSVEQAEEALRRDLRAKKLLSDYQSLQLSVQRAQMWGERVPKDKSERLRSIEAEMNSNLLVGNLTNAQKRLQETLVALNNEISNLLGIDFASNSSSGCC